MPDFTAALAKGLDARRRIFHGTSPTLALLDHARPNRRGYDALCIVPDGWHYSGGREIDEPIILHIAESETVTAEKLNKATAFGINGKVWIIEENGRQAPTYPAMRIWRFSVKPSGEFI
jgi:hypothetical protein